jgi:hypothetical protein
MLNFTLAVRPGQGGCCSPQPAKETTVISRLLQPAALFGGALAIGMIGGGALMGNGMVHAMAGDRAVTVRGVSEREAKANIAVLPITVSASSEVSTEAQDRVDRETAELRRFLAAQGYRPEQIEMGRFYVSDGYIGVEKEDRPALRWTAHQSVSVRTSDVDRVAATTRALNDRIRSGELEVDYSEPSFYFTGLNDLRAPMIGEATAAARLGAQEFAQDSGSRLGGIKEASQGYFEVEGRDPAGGSEETQVFKRVRVVTTVSYQLK